MMNRSASLFGLLLLGTGCAPEADRPLTEDNSHYDLAAPPISGITDEPERRAFEVPVGIEGVDADASGLDIDLRVEGGQIIATASGGSTLYAEIYNDGDDAICEVTARTIIVVGDGTSGSGISNYPIDGSLASDPRLGLDWTSPSCLASGGGVGYLIVRLPDVDAELARGVGIFLDVSDARELVTPPRGIEPTRIDAGPEHTGLLELEVENHLDESANLWGVKLSFFDDVGGFLGFSEAQLDSFPLVFSPGETMTLQAGTSTLPTTPAQIRVNVYWDFN